MNNRPEVTLEKRKSNFETYRKRFELIVDQIRNNPKEYILSLLLSPWDSPSGEVLEADKMGLGTHTVGNTLPTIVERVASFIEYAKLAGIEELSAEDMKLVEDYVNAVNYNLWDALSEIGDKAKVFKRKLVLRDENTHEVAKVVNTIDSLFSKPEYQEIGFKLLRPEEISA